MDRHHPSDPPEFDVRITRPTDDKPPRLLVEFDSVDAYAAYQERLSRSPSSEARPLPQPEDILTPTDVARVLAIPRKTVVALCAEGRFEGAFKAGRQWRVPGRAVRKLAGFDVAAPEVRSRR